MEAHEIGDSSGLEIRGSARAWGVRLPPFPRKHSDIAQLVEQFIRNEPVARSSRAVGAIWRGTLIGKRTVC